MIRAGFLRFPYASLRPGDSLLEARPRRSFAYRSCDFVLQCDWNPCSDRGPFPAPRSRRAGCDLERVGLTVIAAPAILVVPIRVKSCCTAALVTRPCARRPQSASRFYDGRVCAARARRACLAAASTSSPPERGDGIDEGFHAGIIIDVSRRSARRAALSPLPDPRRAPIGHCSSLTRHLPSSQSRRRLPASAGTGRSDATC